MTHARTSPAATPSRCAKSPYAILKPLAPKHSLSDWPICYAQVLKHSRGTTKILPSPIISSAPSIETFMKTPTGVLATDRLDFGKHKDPSSGITGSSPKRAKADGFAGISAEALVDNIPPSLSLSPPTRVHYAIRKVALHIRKKTFISLMAFL
uniref:Uncharacterized protein n=1 Tax=Oryza rufipogon TaxID=4529 RepID=A0A0E0NE28_ORYRU